MGFYEFGNRFGVFQHREGLLEGLEILRTHQDSRWCPVSCDYYPLVMFLNSFDELRKPVPDRPQRFTAHGHNCATRQERMEEAR